MREERMVRPYVGGRRCGGRSRPSPSVVLRRALMQVLTTVWSGYEICWAYDGTEELAGYVGYRLPPDEWDRQPTLKLARGRNHMCRLISVVGADGQLPVLAA